MYKFSKLDKDGNVVQMVTANDGEKLKTILSKVRVFLEACGHPVLGSEEVVLYDFDEPRESPKEEQ